MTEQQKTNQIATFNKQIAALKEQINKTNAEIKIHIEKRNKLNDQFKKQRQEINKLKNERNCLNEKVKALKQQRDESRTKIKTIIEQIKTHRQRTAELKKKRLKRSHRELQKELESIEWKIQTTPLDLKEEKRLIENVKKIEAQLNICRKIKQHKKIIAELMKELESLELNATTSHQELTVSAQKSQEIHANMLAKISESENIKREADRLHNAYIQAKKQAKPLHQEMKELTEKRKKLQDAIKEESERQKKNAEKTLKEKLESQARDKLQRGEKLSWNEFQLLINGDSHDHQTQD
ncbi:MAG: hypothetical protein JSW44_01460 [Candidatus Bathyarchaeota archaeon]|nr:MAG: hypothetical protein JSW44_01460 [Candidatus Bathyarchaeota archaeon]